MREIPEGWRDVLAVARASDSYASLERFVDAERSAHRVFPAEPNVFRALELTRPGDVRVVILGQDPYHGEGQAHGLAFSVEPGVLMPPSLANIFKELHADLGEAVPPASGDLSAWARNGVLLLNAVLTVRSGEPLSHRGRGWEEFTDAVLAYVASRMEPAVFVLWGAVAHKKRRLIDEGRHEVVASAHPSPLSAHRGFFGSRPFSRTNDALVARGLAPVDWELIS